MKLYLIQPKKKYTAKTGVKESPWKPWYDKTFGLVIAAESKNRVRELAEQNTSYEQTEWTDEYTEITLLSENCKINEEKVVLDDFRSA